jgi:hypothetical protein
VEAPDSKRRWFQLHLSTAVIVMFAAGLLLFLNCRKEMYGGGYYTQGWPGTFYYSGGYQQSLSFHLGPLEPAVLIVNVLFCLMILASLATLCELRIRGTGYWAIAVIAVFFAMTSVFSLIVLSMIARPWIGHWYPK